MELDHKPVVLMVDDEPNILQGLRRALRAKRDSWEMVFAEGGQQALDRLKAGPVDVLVCDMRMPNVDGTMVLAATAKAYPESVRIILSGHADRDAMLEGLAAAHQFLPKPCDANTLVSAIEESLALRALLPLAPLRRLLGKFTVLPTPSERYFELIRELDYPIASAKTVGEVLERDLGLSALVLRLMNSAYFSLPKRVTKCREAVEMLGFDTIRALVTLSEFYLRTDLSPKMVRESQDLAYQSLRIAGLARQIAHQMRVGTESVENAATAGLLCHVGTVVLRLNFPADYEWVEKSVLENVKSISEIELGVFGAGHAALGGFLVGIWGFPNAVIEAVAFHHNPSLAGRSEKGALAAVHLAQALAADTSLYGSNKAGGEGSQAMVGQAAEIDQAYLESIGLHDLSLEALAKEIKIVRTNSA